MITAASLDSDALIWTEIRRTWPPSMARNMPVITRPENPAMPRPTDLAMERHVTYAQRPLADFVGFVDLVIAAINRAIQSQAMRQFQASIGDEPAGGTPEEFAALIAADSQKWGEVIKRAGIRLE